MKLPPFQTDLAKGCPSHHCPTVPALPWERKASGPFLPRPRRRYGAEAGGSGAGAASRTGPGSDWATRWRVLRGRGVRRWVRRRLRRWVRRWVRRWRRRKLEAAEAAGA